MIIEVTDVDGTVEYPDATALVDLESNVLMIINPEIQGESDVVLRSALIAEYAPGYWQMWRIRDDKGES